MENLTLIKPEKVQNIINKFCYTIGMIPTSYKISLTYEEQIIAIGHYLEETVIPALNNNAEAVAELQALFVQLKDYVENYFDNLDIQNEVNNKLDKMIENGQLSQIIGEYIGENYTYSYNTLQDLKIDTNVAVGSRCITLGYNEVGDEGNAEYIITNQNNLIANEGNIVALDNGLVAILVYNRNINVKQFGAKGDNLNDDTQAFQNAIDFIKSFSSFNDYSKKNVLEIPAGDYKILNTINLSPLVKIKTTGYAFIHSYVQNILFNLNIEGQQPIPGSSVDRYNYLFGDFIDGSAGFRIVNELETRGDTCAFSLGARDVVDTSLNYNLSKTNFNFITINNFNTGILINPYNFYVNNFNNIYMEGNNRSIVVGIEGVENYKDSGENISFNKCIFAGSNIVCLYNTPLQSIDFNFNECSFDFNNCLFYSPNNNENTSAARKINIANCNIEALSYQTTSNSQPHGILFGTFRAYLVIISNSRIYITNEYHLFYSESKTSYMLNLINNIITTSTNQTNPNVPFLANDNISNINVYNNLSTPNVGLYSKLSSFNNCVINPDFRKFETDTIFEITNTNPSTIIGDFQQAYWNDIDSNVIVSDDSPLPNGKSLELTVNTSNHWTSETANQGSSFTLLTKKIPCNPLEIYGISSLIKNLKTATTIRYITIYYDENDKEIRREQATAPYTPNTEWQLIGMPRYFKTPTNTKYFKISTTFVQASYGNQTNGDKFNIGGIFIEKVK